MEIDIKGHSGCQIEIINNGKRLEICKSTSDRKYMDRLLKQANKQEGGVILDSSRHIRVPEIYAVERTDSRVAIHMEYVYSKSYISYFEDAGIDDINCFIMALKALVDGEIAGAPVQQVSTEIIKRKFDDVLAKCKSNALLCEDRSVDEILSRSQKIFHSLAASIEIPVGRCHGDLTFSNILFSGHNYYLIDFLDSFIESPIMDLVKIRQDSRHEWSKLMYKGNTDHVRLSIISRKIDTEIDSYYSSFEWYMKYYDLFQLMNFLRILQYAKEKQVIDYLKNVITPML